MPDKQYEADDDPDTGAATTPDDVEAKTERDQAEGDGEPPGDETDAG